MWPNEWTSGRSVGSNGSCVKAGTQKHSGWGHPGSPGGSLPGRWASLALWVAIIHLCCSSPHPPSPLAYDNQDLQACLPSAELGLALQGQPLALFPPWLSMTPS